MPISEGSCTIIFPSEGIGLLVVRLNVNLELVLMYTVSEATLNVRNLPGVTVKNES
jgi:hypothetical protein